MNYEELEDRVDGIDATGLVTKIAAEFEGLQIAELAKLMDKAGAYKDRMKKEAVMAQLRWDVIRKIVIPNKLDEMGMDSAKIKGVGTVSKRADAYCNVKAGCQEDLMNWLRDNGYADLIRPNVNSSSLKAFIKELFNEGKEIPSDIVNFTPFTYVAITHRPKG